MSGCISNPRPLIIAHRGASGNLAEHTIASYTLAYGMGADVIEPDVVLTRDAVAVCSHDLTVHDERAIAMLVERFPERRRDDGKFYLIDFDLAELRALGRPLGRNADRAPGQGLVTFDEMIDLVRRLNTDTGRSVAIVPEAKSPSFHRDNGRPIEPLLVEALARHGYTRRTDGAIIQCFELDALKRMRRELGCDLPMVYLAGDPISDEVLDDVASFADAIGPSRRLIEEDDGTPGKQPDLFEKARARGLGIYVWTFARDEALTRKFLRMPGVTGIFTDCPDVGVRARG